MSEFDDRNWREVRELMASDNDIERLFIKDEDMGKDNKWAGVSTVNMIEGKVAGVWRDPKYRPIINRFKSLLWRLCAFIVVGIIDFAIVELSNFQIDGRILLLVSLILGEVSKFLNNKYGLKKA